MHFQGIWIGLIAFLIIGIFHPIVKAAEYHIGKRVWPVFLVGGLVILAASVWIGNAVLEAAAGVLGFTMLWSIHELFEQEKRVEKGWFPANPKKNKGQKERTDIERADTEMN